MFVCYLDDTDNTHGPTMGIAGYLGIARAWEEFEVEVLPFLEDWRVFTLRGKDFHNGHGDFKGWDGPKKERFLHGLYKIAGKYVLSGVSSTLDKSYYNSVKAESRFKNVSKLGIVFSSFVGAILFKDAIPYFEKLAPGKEFDVSFVVEMGNKNNGNLVRLLHWIKADLMKNDPRLGGISFVEKHDCKAIQLADFLAFHGRRESDRWSVDGYSDSDFKGHALNIMSQHIPHRHNRLYDDGRGARWIGPATFLTADIDEFNLLILPEKGLR